MKIIQVILGLTCILIGSTLLTLIEIRGVDLTEGQRLSGFWHEYGFISAVSLLGVWMLNRGSK